MRIAFFSDTFHPAINGVVMTIIETATYLQERGHEVLVIVPNSKDDSEQPDDSQYNFTVHRTPSVNGRLYPDFVIGLPDGGLLKLLKDFKPDVIHNHVPFSLGLQGVLLAKYLKIPLVVTHHTNYSDPALVRSSSFQDLPMVEAMFGTVEKLLRFFYNNHDVVLAPSNNSLSELKEFGVHVPVVVSPSTVDIQEMQAAKKAGVALRKKLKLSDQTLLYVGRISGEKSIDAVIELFSKVHQSLPKTQLILIGDGPAESALRRQVDELGLTETVIFYGRVPHEELITAGHFYLGDIFITMSQWETLGLSTIEAMACGLPVVAAKARANIENVEGVGILVEAEDQQAAVTQLVQLLTNPKQYQQMAKASIKKAKEFTPDEVIGKLEKVYSILLEHKHKTANTSHSWLETQRTFLKHVTDKQLQQVREKLRVLLEF